MAEKKKNVQRSAYSLDGLSVCEWGEHIFFAVAVIIVILCVLGFIRNV